MSNDKPAREWWIYDVWDPVKAERFCFDDQTLLKSEQVDEFHAIEHSAYAAVCAERDEAIQRWEDTFKQRDMQVKLKECATKERDEARGEVDRLQKINELHIESKVRLEKDNAQLVENCGALSRDPEWQTKALLAEAEAALERIASEPTWGLTSDEAYEDKYIARETLARLREKKGSK